MTLPISVVVPHLPSREKFFQRFCLPSIEANRPAQIIVVPGPGGACDKRNQGAAQAREPFLVFADDDMIVGSDCLGRLLEGLEAAQSPVGYAYCDHVCFTWPGAPGSRHEVFQSRPFDAGILRRGNYINTLAVMRTALFPGFDPAIRRYQDWDLWLTMLERGVHGAYVPGFLFANVTIDVGITASQPNAESMQAVRKKHNLHV